MPLEIGAGFLSVHNLIGFVTTPPSELASSELVEQIYSIGTDFKETILDTAYADGPIYFKKILFSQEDSLENVIIFTSVGNEFKNNSTALESLIFEKEFLLNSPDVTSIGIGQLNDVYDFLIRKYDTSVRSIAVYHVLYRVGDDIHIDVYSEVS